MGNEFGNTEKAFDYAVDLTKLLMTFSTAILAFTATFGKEVPEASTLQKGIVIGSWVCYILSVGFGFLTLMALTGNLDPKPQRRPNPKDRSKTILEPQPPILSINSANVVGTSQLQFYSFVIALALTATYSYRLLFPPKMDQNVAKHVVVIHEGKIKGDSFHIHDSVIIPK